MKPIVKDALSSGLLLVAAVIVFARLQSYSWWLIGSWKGALGVLAVLGLTMIIVNISEMWRMVDYASITEFVLWILAATVVIAGLFTATTKAVFIAAAILIALPWAAQLLHHRTEYSHHRGQHYYL